MNIQIWNERDGWHIINIDTMESEKEIKKLEKKLGLDNNLARSFWINNNKEGKVFVEVRE